MKSAGKCIAFVLLLFVSGSVRLLCGQDIARQVVTPANYKATGAPYSPGVLVDGTLYVSGQGSKDASGTRPPAVEDKVRQALRNVRGVLQGAGMDYGNIAWLNIYLVHSGDVDAVNRAYWGEIGVDPPARTEIGRAHV